MDKAYAELDDVKAEVEKLRAECRVKTQLLDSLKKDCGEQFLKFQEITQLAEKRAHELDLKSEEIHELKKIHEDLKSSLHEKEAHIAHLSSENNKIQASCAERVLTLEESNRELVLALDELKARNNNLEQNACASTEEISGLKTLLLATEKKYLEAQEKVQQATTLRLRDDVIQQLEEQNISMQDQIKWRNEQFKHLEDAHEQLQAQFQFSKEEWEKERSSLVHEISSLQISLDSQTTTLEGLRSRLEMCNHALACEESKRKLLEAEISEFKNCFNNVYSQCEEKKSEIQQLNILRNDEIARLRNSLGEKETLAKELERKIVHLEQDNQELGDSLKELREAQIRNGGANSLISKLRNKLRRLEEVHKSSSSILKSKESQWENQLAKMEADIISYRSTLTNKEQEIMELRMELEKCYYAIEENHIGLLIFKSVLAEAYSKSCDVEIGKAVCVKEKENMVLISTEQLRVKDDSLKALARQQFLFEEELEQQKNMLEESSAGQFILREQLLQMENSLKHERNVAFEALEKLRLEIANKNEELSRLDCEAQNWKSTAETLKVSYEEIQGTCKKTETSLLSQIENEQALKQENENFLCVVKDQERKIEDLQRQIALLELCNADKTKEAERCKQEKDDIVQIAVGKDCCIKDLQKDIAVACLKQESMKKELDDAVLTRLDAQKALEQEEEILWKIKEEKDQIMKHFQELAKAMEQDLLDALCFSFSNQVEKLVEVSVLTEALKNAECLTKLEIEEKNTRIMKSELEINNLLENMAHKEESFFHFEEKDQIMKHFQELAKAMEQDLLDALCFSFSNQVEKLVEVSVLTEALKNAECLTKLEIEEKNTRIMKSELEINNLLENMAHTEESFFHLKHEAKQLQTSLEAMKLENEKLMDRQQNMEHVITEIKFEKGNLLQDIMKLSTEREDMVAHMEYIWDRVGELSSGDLQLMERLGNILNTSVDDENETAMDSVACDKLHDSDRDSANGLLISPTNKKCEENFDGRLPLREVNSLHM